MKNIRLPILAVAAAIVITTTMDFTGYTMFSALPLTALILVLWLIQRQSKAEIGLTLGSLNDYAMALSYPVIVLGAATLVAFLAGDLSLGDANWKNVGINVLAGSTIGSLMVLLTEEGFFRGWLWGAFRKAPLSNAQTLVATSLLFTAWHVSAVTSGTDYGLPWAQVPVYLTNALLLGLIWGLMRLLSGSVVVASVSHAVWNAFAYSLFGFGTKVGQNRQHSRPWPRGRFPGTRAQRSVLLLPVHQGKEDSDPLGLQGPSKSDIVSCTAAQLRQMKDCAATE